MAILFALALSTAWAMPPWMDSEPRPFVFDGCTLFSEGTHEVPMLWSHCCLEHDLLFWAGGSKDARDSADRALRECVRLTGAERIADLMYLGVRLGSKSPWKLRHGRWGNAWSAEQARYRRLTRDEIDAIESAIGSYRLPDDILRRLLDAIRRDSDA